MQCISGFVAILYRNTRCPALADEESFQTIKKHGTKTLAEIVIFKSDVGIFKL